MCWETAVRRIESNPGLLHVPVCVLHDCASDMFNRYRTIAGAPQVKKTGT
jgi:hypothetical protein